MEPPTAVPATPLGPRAVHVWYVLPDAVTDPARLDAYAGLLSAEERERHGRFHFPEDRHVFLVSHALVRVTLSRYARVDPRAWTFVANEHGCPAIAGPAGVRPLRFNLSHTRGLAACAVSLGREVGVDVEDTGRRGADVGIADRYFSRAEVEALRALPAAAQRPRFFEYWTLKESYIKARGMGLALPLEQFSFQLPAAGPIAVTFDPRLGDDPRRWQFGLYRPTERHVLAVGAARGDGPDLEITLRGTVP